MREQVLRLPVGGPAVVRSQLNHIQTMLVRKYIAFRVVPIALGAHAGLSSLFTMLRYDKFEPVVYLDNYNTGVFLEEKGSLDTFTDVLKGLNRDALDAEQSRRLIASMLS